MPLCHATQHSWPRTIIGIHERDFDELDWMNSSSFIDWSIERWDSGPLGHFRRLKDDGGLVMTSR